MKYTLANLLCEWSKIYYFIQRSEVYFWQYFILIFIPYFQLSQAILQHFPHLFQSSTSKAIRSDLQSQKGAKGFFLFQNVFGCKRFFKGDSHPAYA